MDGFHGRAPTVRQLSWNCLTSGHLAASCWSSSAITADACRAVERTSSCSHRQKFLQRPPGLRTLDQGGCMSSSGRAEGVEPLFWGIFSGHISWTMHPTFDCLPFLSHIIFQSPIPDKLGSQAACHLTIELFCRNQRAHCNQTFGFCIICQIPCPLLRRLSGQNIDGKMNPKMLWSCSHLDLVFTGPNVLLHCTIIFQLPGIGFKCQPRRSCSNAQHGTNRSRSCGASDSTTWFFWRLIQAVLDKLLLQGLVVIWFWRRMMLLKELALRSQNVRESTGSRRNMNQDSMQWKLHTSLLSLQRDGIVLAHRKPFIPSNFLLLRILNHSFCLFVMEFPVFNRSMWNIQCYALWDWFLHCWKHPSSKSSTVLPWKALAM